MEWDTRLYEDDTFDSEDVDIADEVRAGLTAPALDVVVTQGRAVLLGTVRSLWELSVARRAVSAFPRVRAVSTEAVVVDAERVPDPAIRHAIRGVLRADCGIDQETVTAGVRGGRVAISGVVADGRERDGILWRIERVRGVRSIDDRIAVSPAGKTGQPRARADAPDAPACVFSGAGRRGRRVRPHGRVERRRGRCRSEGQRRASRDECVAIARCRKQARDHA